MQLIDSIWDAFISIAKSFRFNDFIDIVLVSFIVYKLIQLVRETRAAQIFKGVLFLIFAYFLANILHLNTIQFLLKNLFEWIVVGVLILFQPEFRRALEKMGRTNVVKTFNFFSASNEDADDMSRCVDIVVKTAKSFSISKIGAIIVFERKIKLGEQVLTGTMIQAKPSEALLGSIFFHNTPLHDGAVIIRDAQILAAGCFLPKPLAEEFVDKNLGSRHRAALGISEVSDAVAVVVSEETGKISVVIDGKIKQGTSAEELEAILKEVLLPAPSAAKIKKKARKSQE